MKDELAEVSRTPNLTALHTEYQRSINDAYRTRHRFADDTRFAYWETQSTDGKKWDKNFSEGKRAFPFNGASDVRVRLADEIIQDNVDTLKSAFKRAQFVAEGIGPEDAARSGHTTKRLDWARNVGLPELDTEHELLEQYVETYGWGALQIIWERRLAKRLEQIGMDEILSFAIQIREAQQDSPVADLPTMIADESAEEAAAELLMGIYPGFVMRQSGELRESEVGSLGKRDAKRLVRSLRETGSGTFPVPYVSSNNPKVAALKPFEEIFFPPETADIQRARAIFRVDWLTETELKSKVLSDGWNNSWVENVIEKAKGLNSNLRPTVVRETSAESVYDLQGGEKRYLHEIVWAYTKGVKNGVECIYCTVFSPHTDLNPNGDAEPSQYGSHVLLNYAHGRYPFEVKTRERTVRAIVESRGVPEIVATWQTEIKAQRDSLVDRTSLSVSPPLKVPLRNIGKTYRLAPMQQVGVTRPDEIEWMDPPKGNYKEALEVINSVKNDADEFFGRISENVPPVKSQVRQQNMVDCDLAFWVQVFKQVDALMQQFMPMEQIFRISGGSANSGDFSDIQRQVDWRLRFDVRDLNTEFMIQKLEALTKFALSADKAGVVDMAGMVEMMINMVDPGIRQAVVTSPSAANQKMYDQVLRDVMAMAQGNEVPYTENDPTAERQLKFAQDIIQGNPKYMEQIQQDEIFAGLFEKWSKNRQQSIMQRQNSMIGRLGVTPSNAQTY